MVALTVSPYPYIRNNFSFLGVSEFSEEPDYLKVFEFEKHDFIPHYFWLKNNMLRVMALGPIYIFSMLALQRWMRDRKPFNLRKPLMLWSASLSLISLVMFVRLLPELLYVYKEHGLYSAYCKRDHFSAAGTFWMGVYCFSKVLEFIDTVFIVLRKQRLTFLHVFHHTSILIATVWALVRWDPPARIFAMLNTFVHTVMYAYFAFKAAQFKLPRALAMSVTAVQLIQFVLCLIVNSLAVYAKVAKSEPPCERENDVSAFYLSLGAYYLYLFGSFFIQNYISKAAAKPKLQ